MSFTRKTANFTRKVTHLIVVELFITIVNLQEKTNMTYKHKKEGFCEKKGWINIVQDRGDGKDYALLEIHPTKKQAEEVQHHLNAGLCNYVTTIKIEWEEEKHLLNE